jgi:hypothetical protein
MTAYAKDLLFFSFVVALGLLCLWLWWDGKRKS